MAEMDIYQVLKYLPQRYPVLMIDKVGNASPASASSPSRTCRRTSRISRAIFPAGRSCPGADPRGDGAGRRRAGVQRRRRAQQSERSVYYYVGIDNARFKKPVVPGDVLEIEVVIERALRGIGKFGCVARVDGQLVAEATILCSVRPGGPR